MATKVDSSYRIDAQRLSKALNRMINFQLLCRFRILVLHFALGYFTFDNHIEKLQKIFCYIDSRYTGSLSDKDLYKVAKRIYRDSDQTLL